MLTRDDILSRRKFLIRVFLVVQALVIVVGTATYLIVRRPFIKDFTIEDQLGGNIFPSAILSVATTDAQIIQPVKDIPYLGNPKSSIGIKLRSSRENSEVKIELASTPFYEKSVSTFILPEAHTDYYVYPDILWRYDALRNNEQAEPINVVAHVDMNGRDCGLKIRTFSVRSINECLLGYNALTADGRRSYVSTRLFFAAYVNEENPAIDKLLREALNTRIVRRFEGYQVKSKEALDRQVYALWFTLQKRNFRYSSVSYSSLSSNVVYAQRVRTFEDALNNSQINCVDGSVLFASLLRAINITPVLVQTPGHMFVGYYNDSKHKELTFLETTMIGDVDLDTYFPDENLDSTKVKKSPAEQSRLTFEKSKEYAAKAYRRAEKNIRSNKQGYMFVEISKAVRRKVQSIGK